VAIKAPTFSPDDQEYYPLHEEDDVPETVDHEAAIRYARGVLAAYFPEWFITGNVCVYWERGNTRDYRAPDLFAVKEPLAEPVTRVYQLWKQPLIAFVLEVGSRTTFRKDVGPKVELYQDRIRAAEYGHVDLDHGRQRLWRLGPNGLYEEMAPEPNGRLRSQELGLEFGLDAESILRFYTPDGEMLLAHEEEARLRQEEARLRREAEERAADLERQLAELRAQRSE
jgi:Uma2 family endonuclease